MKTPGKLKFIQEISGYSQEKLAKELGVSFATLNSWINARSTPRKKAQGRIDNLYRKLSGEKTIPDDVLSAKKQIIEKKKRGHKNILKNIFDRPDIYKEFVLTLTYNTNSIEGSTLTENETATVLFQDAALPDKSLIEQIEAKNHQAALKYLFDYIFRKKSIDENLILKLHSILMNGIRDDAGRYRSHGVRIAGANVPTANYLKVSALMKELLKDIGKVRKDKIAHVSEIHSRFEKIHPFSDGNGRIGRLMMNAMLLERDFPPAVIKQEKKRFYYSYLNKSQIEGDFSLLEDFVCDSVLSGFKIIEK